MQYTSVSDAFFKMTYNIHCVIGAGNLEEPNVAYWKCENNATLRENLPIPITNEWKERALRLAAQQRMSDKEKNRRILTGIYYKKKRKVDA